MNLLCFICFAKFLFFFLPEQLSSLFVICEIHADVITVAENGIKMELSVVWNDIKEGGMRNWWKFGVSKTAWFVVRSPGLEVVVTEL